MPTVEEKLQRLAKEREEADRRYNEALTALDKAVTGRLDVPDPSPAFDDHQIDALNDAWNILPAPPTSGGVKGRVADFVWRIVSPCFQRQLTFNSWLVDHLNRNLAAAREAHQAALEDVEAIRAHSGALVEFQTRLIQYLQQITLYVDTRDAGIRRRGARAELRDQRPRSCC